MFGIIGTIIGWMGYQVGLRTDAPDPSGSLQSKVKDVKNSLTGLGAAGDSPSPTGSANAKLACLIQRVGFGVNPTLMWGFPTVYQGCWNTLINLSGSGVLYDYYLAPFYYLESMDYIAGLRITVDGSYIVNWGYPTYIYPIVHGMISSNYLMHWPLVRQPIRFGSSLTLEVFNARGNLNVVAIGNYKIGVA